MDARGKNDHSHSHPEAENAWHPDADKNTVIMVFEKPECDACDETYERADEEGIVDFVNISNDYPNIRRSASYFVEAEFQLGRVKFFM